MPNWCQNNLEIQGNAEDIAAIAALCGCHEGRFDFNAIVPMPAALQITCGSATDHGLEVLYGNWKHVLERLRPRLLDRLGSELPATREVLIEVLESNVEQFPDVSLKDGRQAKANLEAWGHKTWYSWRLEHWGTKWALDPEEIDVDVADTAICVSFDTAWAPPVPVMRALCRRFPRVQLTMQYREEGVGFCGMVCGAGGGAVDIPGDGADEL